MKLAEIVATTVSVAALSCDATDGKRPCTSPTSLASVANQRFTMVPKNVFVAAYAEVLDEVYHVDWHSNGTYEGTWATLNEKKRPGVSLSGRYEYRQTGCNTAELTWLGEGHENVGHHFVSQLMFSSPSSGFFTSFEFTTHPTRRAMEGTFKVGH